MLEDFELIWVRVEQQIFQERKCWGSSEREGGKGSQSEESLLSVSVISTQEITDLSKGTGMET